MKIKSIKFYSLLSLLFISLLTSFFISEKKTQNNTKYKNIKVSKWAGTWANDLTEDWISKVFNTATYYYNKSNPNKRILLLEITKPIFFAKSIRYGYTENMIDKINHAKKDPKIVALLLRVNSPGGTVGASQELFEAFKRFQASGKKIVASIADLAASGAYYAILPADEIIGNRGSLIGSIGVLLTSAEIYELLNLIGVKINYIKSVPYKDILSPTRKQTTFEKNYLQKLVQQEHKYFLDDVIQFRGKKGNPQKIKKAANGLLYTTKEAINIGLVDKIGDFEFAKKRITELANMDYDSLQEKRQSNNWISDVKPLFRIASDFFGSLPTSTSPSLQYRLP